jgi:F-type H+-transporting ATPase subunit delta
MSDSTIARRYAGALKAEADRTDVTKLVDSDVELIQESFALSAELRLFFESPVISREDKKRVVYALFSDRLQRVTLNFLQLLVRKRREHLLESVTVGYRELRDTELGIVEASARVTHPLDETEEKNLVAAIEGISGKRVRLKTEIDTYLMGGIVVRVGDTVYDGSVRNQLLALRERLESGSHLTN